MVERSPAFTRSVGIGAFVLVYPSTAEPDAAVPATCTALVLGTNIILACIACNVIYGEAAHDRDPAHP